jgi:hypothetical protein
MKAVKKGGTQHSYLRTLRTLNPIKDSTFTEQEQLTTAYRSFNISP